MYQYDTDPKSLAQPLFATVIYENSARTHPPTRKLVGASRTETTERVYDGARLPGSAIMYQTCPLTPTYANRGSRSRGAGAPRGLNFFTAPADAGCAAAFGCGRQASGSPPITGPSSGSKRLRNAMWDRPASGARELDSILL